MAALLCVHCEDQQHSVLTHHHVHFPPSHTHAGALLMQAEFKLVDLLHLPELVDDRHAYMAKCVEGIRSSKGAFQAMGILQRVLDSVPTAYSNAVTRGKGLCGRLPSMVHSRAHSSAAAPRDHR